MPSKCCHKYDDDDNKGFPYMKYTLLGLCLYGGYFYYNNKSQCVKLYDSLSSTCPWLPKPPCADSDECC